jgi:hypothetical protein
MCGAISDRGEFDMIRKALIGGLLLPVLATIGQAEDKPKLPEGSPPRIVSIVGMKGDVVTYRDFFSMPIIPKAVDQPNPKELAPALHSAGPAIACAVEFSLKEGEVFDAEGNRLDAEAAKTRLVVGATVLVSTSEKKVDPAYLRIVEKKALILVHPLPPPGPPLPGCGQ